jgi:glyoxylase-like metal-dependent hydrolase (beta-lactamase superfamily II)
MTLEDHVGDVLRKARLMKHLDLETVAAAAGVSAAAYSAIEESGETPAGFTVEALEPLLELGAKKLAHLIQGWLPSPVDLSQWRHLRQITTEEGMAVHCYLVWDEASREAALFDTGWTLDPVLQIVAEEKLELKHLFITHTHRDHVAALTRFRELFPKAAIHTDAAGAPMAHKNRRNDRVSLGGLRISNRDTPGHAEDGVTYLIGNWPDDAPHVAVVGDAIFAGSMGGAKEHGALAKAKVREQILSLPDDTLLCPGHGPLTTVGEEKRHNPFFCSIWPTPRQ